MISTPDVFGKARDIKTIRVEDDRGRMEFSGPHRVADACAYSPKGPAAWFVQRRDETWRPVVVPVEAPKTEIAPAPPQNITPKTADPVALALEYGDKNARLIAQAYATAFTVAGQSWANVVQPLTHALEALSRRVVSLEEQLENVPILPPQEPPEPPQPNPLDQLAEGVLAGVVQGAMGAGSPK